MLRAYGVASCFGLIHPFHGIRQDGVLGYRTIKGISSPLPAGPMASATAKLGSPALLTSRFTKRPRCKDHSN